MKRKHLSWEGRSIIERLVQAGKTNKAIAEVLGRSKSTIGRELERNCWRLKCREYRSKTADEVAKKRRRHERKSRISEEIWQKIFEFYNEDWSPEQISGALKLRGIFVSQETIYHKNYAEIRAGRLDRKSLECAGVFCSPTLPLGTRNEREYESPSEAVFSEEGESNLLLGVPRGLPTEN